MAQGWGSQVPAAVISVKVRLQGCSPGLRHLHTPGNCCHHHMSFGAGIGDPALRTPCLLGLIVSPQLQDEVPVLGTTHTYWPCVLLAEPELHPEPWEMQLWLQAPQCREGEGCLDKSHRAPEGQGTQLAFCCHTSLREVIICPWLSCQTYCTSSNERPISTLELKMF